MRKIDFSEKEVEGPTKGESCILNESTRICSIQFKPPLIHWRALLDADGTDQALHNEILKVLRKEKAAVTSGEKDSEEAESLRRITY